MTDEFKFLDDIDWADCDTNIQLNDKLLECQDDYKIIMSDDFFVNINDLDLFFKTTYSDFFISNILDSYLVLVSDINKYCKTLYNNIGKYLDDIIIIPYSNNNNIFNNYECRNIYEFYNVIKSINSSKNTNIMLFNHRYQIIKDVFELFVPHNNIYVYDEKIKSKNEIDVWFANSSIIYGSIDNIDWWYERIPYYINQLFYMEKYCKNGSSCIIVWDNKLIKNIEIYRQIIVLYSCFMNVRIVWDKMMRAFICFVIGENLNLDKLRKWCKNKSMLPKHEPSFISKINLCKAIKPIPISINIINSGNKTFDKNIANVVKKINICKEKTTYIVLKSITITKENIVNSINSLFNKQIKVIDKHLKNISFIEHNKYFNKNNIFSYNKIDFYKIYFPNKNNINYDKINISNYELFNLLEPKYIKEIGNIIFKKTDENTIVNMTPYYGLISIYFSEIFKNVVSITDDYNSFKYLNLNNEAYDITNNKTIHDNSIKVILDEKKYKLLFFDLTKNNIVEYKNKKVIKFDDQYIDKVLKILFNKNKKLQIYLLVTNTDYLDSSELKFKVKKYIIDEYILLYIKNDKS